MSIHQLKYIKELLKKFEMHEAKTNDIPITTTAKLDKDELSSPINDIKYRGMIGSLLYLTTSMPDVVFSVGLCARFQSCPKVSHLKAVKMILSYLKGTINLVLWYPKGDSFNLVEYADIDYTGYIVDRKSTSGMAHFVGPCMIFWLQKSKNPLPYLPLKLNMSPHHLVVLNSYGSNNN